MPAPVQEQQTGSAVEDHETTEPRGMRASAEEGDGGGGEGTRGGVSAARDPGTVPPGLGAEVGAARSGSGR